MVRFFPSIGNASARPRTSSWRNFGAVSDYADKIPELLDHPFKFGYRTILLVSETSLGKVTGFSLVIHFPEINSSLLDFLATIGERRGPRDRQRLVRGHPGIPQKPGLSRALHGGVA